MSDKPVLYYFDLPGRAEAIRLAFVIGKIDFEDFRVPFAEWPTKYKPLTPAGQLPVLELGHIKYCESRAILIYAAKRAGLLPEEPELLLTMCQAIDHLEKFFGLLAPLRTAKPEEIEQVRKRQAERVHEELKRYGELIGRTQHEKGYIAGDKLSAADVAAYACLRQIRHPSVAFGPQFASDIPQIHKVVTLLESIPEVRAYYNL